MQRVHFILLGVLVLLGARLCGAAPDPAWLDPRMPEPERAILAEIEGKALPAIEGVLWVGGAPTAEDLDGKVIVLQSWTRATQQGRAVIRRTENLVRRAVRETDVTLITLHTPEQADGALAFIERREPAGFSAIDADGELCDALGIWTRPTTIVVDQSGTIRVAGARLAKLDEIVAAIAKEPAAMEGEALVSRDERDSAAKRDEQLTTDGGDYPAFDDPVVRARDIRGKKGPEVYVQQWVSKPPIMDGKVVMVEFWATWCGPCIKGIPHLNELAAAHRNDLVVIGISDESAGKVAQFMRRTPMDYHVGIDQTEKMARHTMHNGIPHAIVMSPDGIVRWQGHPATLTDKVMSQIIAASKPVGVPMKAPYRWSSGDAE